MHADECESNTLTGWPGVDRVETDAAGAGAGASPADHRALLLSAFDIASCHWSLTHALHVTNPSTFATHRSTQPHQPTRIDSHNTQLSDRSAPAQLPANSKRKPSLRG